MTFDEKKAFLELYQDMLVDTLMLMHEADELRLDMLPKGMRISDMPKAHNANDPMAMFAARLDLVERKQRFLIRGMRNVRKGIEALESPMHRYVLDRYYLCDGWTWQKIAQSTRISERSARRKAHQAISALRFDSGNARAILRYYHRSSESGENSPD